MKNAFVTEVGYRLRDRLCIFLKSGLREDRRARPTKSRNATSALPITLKAARQVGDIFRYVPDGTTPDPRYRFYM